MKNLIAILLALLLLFSLAACDNAPQSSDSSAEETSEAPSSAPTEAAPTAQPEITTEAPTEAPTEVPFPETVLYEYGAAKITAIGCEQETTNSLHILLDIENPDGLRLNIPELYINNIQMPKSYVSISEYSGYISIVLDPLFAFGLETENLSVLELRMTAYDANGGEHAGELVKLELPETEYKEPTDLGNLLFDENNVALYAHLKTGDNFWGTCIYFYFVNNSGRAASVGSTGNPTYNGGQSGVEAAGVMSGEIAAGRAAVFTSNLYDDQLKEAGIYPITDVTGVLSVYDLDAGTVWLGPVTVTIPAD